MTHLLRKSFLRTAACLGLLTSLSSAYGWDEAVPAEGAENLPGVLPAVNETDGQTIYNIPALTLLWESQSVINPARDKVAHMAMDEEVIFVQSSAGVVTAINAESGRRFWSAQVGRNDEVAMTGTSDSQMVIIVTGPVIHAFDKFSGQKLFAYRLPNPPSAPPLIARREVTTGPRVDITRSVFVPLVDRSVVAYDVEVLHYQGINGALKPGVSRALDWRFASGELVRFAPVAGEERLAFATDAGNIHVVDMLGAEKGKSRFQFLMNSTTTAPLALVSRDDKEFLLAACDNNRLFCIDMKTDGSMHWTIPMARPVTQPITVVGNDVFVVSEGNELLKFDLTSGVPVAVSDSVQAVVNQSESIAGELPAYGASIELRSSGLLSFSPIQLMNRSTGQTVTSLIVDLNSAVQDLTFGADEQNQPALRISDVSRKATGFRAAKLSDDAKKLTLEFSDFNPGEDFEFFTDLVHLDIPSWKISHEDLIGAEVNALVSPMRAAAVASSASNRRIEPLPPRSVKGQIKTVSRPWSVAGVKSLVAVSENAVYYSDAYDRVVAVSREHAGSSSVTPTQEYTLRINNRLTDRVYLSTASGRVACFTESRIELGALPVPSGYGLAWLLYPQSQLTPDFARYHQHPGGRPIMPDVPKQDPAPSTVSEAGEEMP